MKSLFRTIGLVAAILLAHSALACDGPQPPNCNCNNSTGQWEINASASAGASSSSKSSSLATGGSASATLNNSGNLSVTLAKGAVSGGTASANIGAGAVQNSTSNTVTVGGSTSSASVAAGAVQNSNHVSASTGASTSSASNNGNGSNNTDIQYESPKTYRSPVETAYSANLTSGMDTCLGSFSAGGQTQILGLTFGKTMIDKNCVLIKQTKLLNENGLHRSACFRMQMGKEGDPIRKAMQDAGEDCPPMPIADVVESAVQGPPPDYVTHGELSEVEPRITTKVTSK